MTFKEQLQKRNEQSFLIQEFANTNDAIIRFYDTAVRQNWELTPENKTMFDDFKDICSRLIEITGEIKAKIPKK